MNRIFLNNNNSNRKTTNNKLWCIKKLKRNEDLQEKGLKRINYFQLWNVENYYVYINSSDWAMELLRSLILLE